MTQRKPAIMLAASSIAVATLLGCAGMTANAAQTDGQDTSPTSITARKTPAYPAGTWFTVDGSKVTGFDPSDGWDDPDTSRTDSATYKVSEGNVEIHDLPDGWTVDTAMTVNKATGKTSAFYLVKDTDGNTYRWYFDGAADITHTIDELRSVTLTVNGEDVDCDPTKDVAVHDVMPGDMIGYTNQPLNWTVKQSDFTEKGVDGYQYVFTPDNADTPTVTYRFYYDAHDSTDELKTVEAYLDDGSPVTGFDPLGNGGQFDIPTGHDVELKNVPDGWSVDALKKSNGSWSIELRKDDGSRYYDYLFSVSDDYKWTYTITQLQNLTAYATPSDTKVEGFGYRGGTWTLPKDSTGVRFSGLPDGWNLDTDKNGDTYTVTISSPDKSITVDYSFNVPRTYSLSELADATATADGEPVTGFDPTTSGTWKVPQGSKVSVGHIPSDWIMTHETGTLTWKVSAPDGSVSVTWTFEEEEPAPSKTDLAEVTATLDDGTPVDGFDPVNGGTFTVPAGTTRVSLDNIPEGWTSTPLTGRLGFILTSKDGSVTVRYVFQPETVYHSVVFYKGTGGKLETVKVKDGGTVEEPEAPTRSGYRFDGWMLDGEPYDFKTPVTGNIILTAAWTRITHTVTFDAGEGSAVAPQTVNHGEPAINPGTPTRDGYTFTGWLLDGEPYDFTQPVMGDITLTAAWEESADPTPTVHTVTVDRGDGSEPVTVQIEDGAPMTKPADPTRDGYTFTGWMLDGEPYDFKTPVTGDITLTAAWEETTAGDALSGVQATVDGQPVDGFDPVKDGKYTVSDPSLVVISDVPEGWTLDDQTSGDGSRTFMLTDGERTVFYVFIPADGGQTTPPDDGADPGTGDTDDGNPDTGDDSGNNDDTTGGDIGFDVETGDDATNPPATEGQEPADTDKTTQDGGNLAQTGSRVIGIIATVAAAAVMAAVAGIAAIARRKRGHENLPDATAEGTDGRQSDAPDIPDEG